MDVCIKPGARLLMIHVLSLKPKHTQEDSHECEFCFPLTLSALHAPTLFLEMSLSWGYLCFQQLSCLLGNQHGGVTIRNPSSYTGNKDLSKEMTSRGRRSWWGLRRRGVG